jgi:hypothetical protein
MSRLTPGRYSARPSSFPAAWHHITVGTIATLRVIARLKWLLTVRHYRQRWGTALATGCGLALVLGLAVGGGVFLFVLSHDQGPAFRDRALAWACWILSLLWVLSPILQLDTQRNLDLNGLRLLPLSRSTFTMAVILDAALSPLGLFFLPLVIITLAVFSLTVADGAVLFIALLLLVTCWLGLGQAIYLWANRLLMSRRFADISMAIGVVLFLLIQGVNLAVQNLDRWSVPPWLAHGWGTARAAIEPLVAWLFPGLAARSVAATARGDLLTALALLLLLAAQALLCAWLAGLAARQFYEGELESGGQAPAKALRVRARAEGPALLGGALGAVFHRERVYLIRDPLLKMLLLQSLIGAVYFIFVALMVNLRARELGEGPFSYIRQYAVLAMALMLSFVESGVMFNKFGYEGGLLSHVLLTPVDRRRLLAAKSLFFMLHFGGINVAIIAGMALIMRAPLAYTVAAVLLVAANTAVVDVIGHFVGIYYPFTYRRQGRRMRAVMPQPGCGYAFLYMLVFQACNLAVLPGTAALCLGVIFLGWPGLFAGALVAGLVVLAGYYFGLPLAARLLEAREPELLAAMTRRMD